MFDESKLNPSEHQKVLRILSESGTEDVHHPLMCEGLPEEAKLYARRELNETEENKAKGMRKLKEYVTSEGLTCTDDSLLVVVLRNCKYDIPKAKSKLKRFLNTRQLTIGKIAQMDMDIIKFILDEFTLGFFPWRDRHGGCIWYTRPNIRLDKYEVDDIVYISLVQVLFLLQFPLSTIYGISYIGDNIASNMNYYHVFKVLRRVLPLLHDMPFRYYRADIINENFFSRWCINMLRPLLPEKLRKRMVCHGSGVKTIYKFHHPDVLPKEIGGTLGPISNKHYRQELLMFIERLKEENKNVQY